jgi:effector-binding domain-containing protein
MMSGGETVNPTCDVVPVETVLLALTHAEIPRSQIPLRIRAMFDIVYTWLREAPVRQAGHNYALYDRCTPQTLRVQIGFPVSEKFADTELVKCVQLATGRAAHAVHVGSYTDLHRTYSALHAWCREQPFTLTGESWEVYGDPMPDPSKLTTGLFLRIDEVNTQDVDAKRGH